jgi:ribosomal protein L11 methyltransferase
VLGITAAALGWRPVLALDYDPLSVAATAENARVNGVDDQIEVRRFDLRAEDVPAAPLVLANLLAPLLESWCERIAGGGPAPASVIASGLLREEADGVASAFARAGLAEAGRRSRGDWSALLLRGGEHG